MPTREEIHDVPPEELWCPCCGAGYAPFGEECCEQIDWQVTLTRIVHRRPTYRRTCGCPVGGVLVAPPVPKAIAKGRFTCGFLARLLVEKFVLGRPAHRIVAALAHDGLDLAEGTLAGVFAACAALLAPLAELITARNAEAGHLHVDETSWPQRTSTHTGTPPSRGASRHRRRVGLASTDPASTAPRVARSPGRPQSRPTPGDHRVPRHPYRGRRTAHKAGSRAGTPPDQRVHRPRGLSPRGLTPLIWPTSRCTGSSSST